MVLPVGLAIDGLLVDEVMAVLLDKHSINHSSLDDTYSHTVDTLTTLVPR